MRRLNDMVRSVFSGGGLLAHVSIVSCASRRLCARTRKRPRMVKSYSEGFAMKKEIFSLRGKRVWVAGHRGMVGSALVRRLQVEDCAVLTVDRNTLDLCDQAAVNRWMSDMRPEVIFLAAAKVGGIVANNTLRADFIYQNIAISANVIAAAHQHSAEKLMFFGSTCVYPRLAPQPMPESCLLSGPLESTNEPYAIAKIAGIKMAEAFRSQYGCDFISVMPTNLCGPGDNYHPEHSHVVAALIRRFHAAKVSGAAEVVVWGTGTPRREFLYVDDLADAAVYLMKTYSAPELINIGTGEDISIADFAKTVAQIVGFDGRIIFDPNRPDGTPRKLVDISRMTTMGWTAPTNLDDALRATYADFLLNVASTASLA
jgi:GDP-L-fucose synthase